jgi:hypothetical protein
MDEVKNINENVNCCLSACQPVFVRSYLETKTSNGFAEAVDLASSEKCIVMESYFVQAINPSNKDQTETIGL